MMLRSQICIACATCHAFSKVMWCTRVFGNCSALQEFERLMNAMLEGGGGKAASKCGPAERNPKNEFVTRLWQEAEGMSTSEDPSISAATLSKACNPTCASLRWAHEECKICAEAIMDRASYALLLLSAAF